MIAEFNDNIVLSFYISALKDILNIRDIQVKAAG
jgi:hypothetical protein